jgi:hypothetical protein
MIKGGRANLKVILPKPHTKIISQTLAIAPFFLPNMRILMLVSLVLPVPAKVEE